MAMTGLLMYKIIATAAGLCTAFSAALAADFAVERESDRLVVTAGGGEPRIAVHRPAGLGSGRAAATNTDWSPGSVTTTNW